MTAWVKMMDGLARLLSSAAAIYVYKDSTDAEAEFSVKAWSTVVAGLDVSYAGATGLGPLSAGATNKIWLDLSAAPTATVGFGANWPAVAHIRLATIAMPATGHWLPSQITRLVGTQAVNPVGGGGAGSAIRSDFAFGTSSPIALGSAAAGSLAGSAVVVVLTAFDGTAPTLTLGDDGNNSRLAEAADVNLKAAGTYLIPKWTKYDTQTALKAYLTPDGSTAGAAVILLERR